MATLAGMTTRARSAEALQSTVPTEEGRAVLAVEGSATGRRWTSRLGSADAERALAIAQQHGIPDLLARVIAGRGVAPQDAPAYLDPSVRGLMPEPYLLRDMEAAAGRIARAITRGERLALLGDYDVDGAVSVALLTRFLRHFDCEPLLHIPDRMHEGYGPSIDAVRRLRAAGASLLVTLDCGTTSHAALEAAAALGLDTVVIDHHQADERLPPAVAVVNPNRQDDLSGQGHLSAGGVALLVLVAINRLLRGSEQHDRAGDPPLLDWLELVALSTICDVVPLIGLNRAFVAKGLVGLRRRRLAGLRALQDVSRLSGPPTCHHLGFLLGPRINAGGRIGDSALGARLLVTDDESEARSIAVALDRCNAERQTLETLMLEQAMAEAERSLATDAERPVILTWSEGWHPGIVGLIASRLKERYGRPALALAAAPDGIATGSARSIAGVDIGSAVREATAQGLLLKGGGHAMAAGLTLLRDRIPALESFLRDRLLEPVSTARLEDSVLIDGALSAGAASISLVEQVERAGPYGSGNPHPVFVLPAHRVAFADLVGAGGHVRCRFIAPDGAAIDAIAFRAGETRLGRAILAARGQPLHVAGRLELDHWNGVARVKLHVEDVAATGPSLVS